MSLQQFGDVITQEINKIQKAELLPGIAAITPEFIKNWTISPHQELAPCLLRVLSTVAQTTDAKEKNKIKKPDMVRRPFFSCVTCISLNNGIALQHFTEAAQLSTLIQLTWLSNNLRAIPMGYGMCTSDD